MADRRIAILRGIAQSGSISQAARDVGVSYKAAWQAIDTLTNLAGVPLVAAAWAAPGRRRTDHAGGRRIAACCRGHDALAQRVAAAHAGRQLVAGSPIWA
jgi:molybdate transport repressor ModE-like protein